MHANKSGVMEAKSWGVREFKLAFIKPDVAFSFVGAVVAIANVLVTMGVVVVDDGVERISSVASGAACLIA